MATNISKEELRLTVDDQTADGLNTAKGNVGALRKSVNKMGASFRANSGLILASLTAIAAGTAAAAIKMTTNLAKTADEAGKLAFRIGANVEGLTELQFVAERSGVKISALNVGLQRLVRRTAEAAKGTGEAKDAIKELGLSATELSKLKADEQFTKVAAALDKVESNADRVRLAFKLFDTEGVSLLQTLQNGTEGMEAMREEARRLGLVIDQDTADAAARLNDEITNLKNVLPGLGNLFGSELLDPLAGVVKLVKDIATTDNFLTRFVSNWTTGVGIIVDNWTAGAREIIGLQEDVAEKSDEIAKRQREAAATGITPIKTEKEEREELKEINRQERINAELERLRLANETAVLTGFERELFMLDTKHEQTLEKLRAQDATEAEIRDAQRLQETQKAIAFEANSLKITQDAAKAEAKEKEELNKTIEKFQRNRLAHAGVIADSLFQLTGKKNKELFAVHKAFAIGQAGIDTHRAVTAALANPPGPPFTFGIAALAAAKGALQVAAISSTTMGGGGGVTAAGAGVGGGGAAPAAPPVPVAPAPSESLITIRILSEGPTEADFINKVTTEIVEDIGDGRVTVQTVK
jgi:hypothetical protein